VNPYYVDDYVTIWHGDAAEAACEIAANYLRQEVFNFGELS